MSNNFEHGNDHEDQQIDLTELWSVVWGNKLVIVIVTLIFMALSVVYAIKQPNIYKASVLLTPTSTEEGVGALSGKLGGLASLAGINLGGKNSTKTFFALELIKSRVFIEKFINKYQLLVPLMAVENWDIKTNTLIYNEDVYDVENKKWMRKVEYPQTPEPSKWEAYRAFSDILAIDQDKKTKMITFTLEHYSPEIAKQWLTSLVTELNSTIRDNDKIEAQTSIDFLTKKIKDTQLSYMQTAFYELIEEQTKTLMLIKISPEYVFKTVDPANVPDTKERPNRALIVILGVMLGGLFSIVIVLLWHSIRKKAS